MLEDLFKIRDLSLNPELVGYREYIYRKNIDVFIHLILKYFCPVL